MNKRHHFSLPCMSAYYASIGPDVERKAGKSTFSSSLTLSMPCTPCADFLQTPSLSTLSGQLGGSNQLSVLKTKS